jgi:hypothetical protein
MSQQAAPGNYPARRICPWLCFVYTRPQSCETVRTFPAAAYFCTFPRDQRRGEIREVVGAQAKAAPLQALGTNTPYQRAIAFEGASPLRLS